MVVQQEFENLLEVCPPFQGSSLTIPPVIEPAEELVELLAGAKIEHSFSSTDFRFSGSRIWNSIFLLWETAKSLLTALVSM